MLTSFFSISKPINFIIVSVFLLFGYSLWIFLNPIEALSLSFFINYILIALVFIFLILLLDFIVRKNSLTDKNNLSIILFCCFILLFPAVFSENNIIISNLFLLLALRRIVSITSVKNTNKKLLDATLFITIASLFYFWSLLYFIVLYIGILQNPKKTANHFLIPIVGFLSVFTLTTTYYLLMNDSFFWFLKIDRSIGIDFSAYQSFSLLIPASIIIALTIWTLFYRISKFSTIAKKAKSNYTLLILVLVISFLIGFLSSTKNGAEFFFVLASLSIITTSYIEGIKEFWFKELLLWVLVLLPIGLMFIN
ncbi:MAG: hypothetical protein ACI85B_002526 [Flavobacteriaceae bacterium]|jgi:hypothetical protein